MAAPLEPNNGTSRARVVSVCPLRLQSVFLLLKLHSSSGTCQRPWWISYMVMRLSPSTPHFNFYAHHESNTNTTRHSLCHDTTLSHYDRKGFLLLLHEQYFAVQSSNCAMERRTASVYSPFGANGSSYPRDTDNHSRKHTIRELGFIHAELPSAVAVCCSLE